MAERDFRTSGLGPALGTIAVPSDSKDDASGAAQPGQLYPGPTDPHALRIKHTTETDGFNTIDQAADKFATPFFLLDNRKAYQLLPADPNRKQATITVGGPNTNFVAIGDQATIDAAAFSGAGGYLLIGLTPFVYHSKAPLYACGLLGTTGIATYVFVERFNSGVPVGS